MDQDHPTGSRAPAESSPSEPCPDGLLCSYLLVRFCIDHWRAGRKVAEFVTDPIKVLASPEGETAFGGNIDTVVQDVLRRIREESFQPPAAESSDP